MSKEKKISDLTVPEVIQMMVENNSSGCYFDLPNNGRFTCSITTQDQEVLVVSKEHYNMVKHLLEDKKDE